MDLGLKGKRVIIAGASSGLGLGCAKALAAEGAIVAIGSRTQSRIEAAAAEVPNSIPVVGDVSTPEGAAAFVNDATAKLGGVDVLVTNAGGPPPGNFASIDIEQYPDALNLNLMSVIAMCKTAIPTMQAQGWGRVVAITSTSVRQPMAQLILSNTARAGATAFLKTLATEVASDGITVNSLQPGLHMTDRITSMYGDGVSELADRVPAGVLGEADDFGQIAAFLCSDAAKFVTGVAIPVDGGAFSGLQ